MTGSELSRRLAKVANSSYFLGESSDPSRLLKLSQLRQELLMTGKLSAESEQLIQEVENSVEHPH